jgi:hypothetical protein
MLRLSNPRVSSGEHVTWQLVKRAARGVRLLGDGQVEIDSDPQRGQPVHQLVDGPALTGSSRRRPHPAVAGPASVTRAEGVGGDPLGRYGR